MASYDALVIYARKIEFDPSAKRLLAEGYVIVENGRTRLEASKAIADLVQRRIVITRGDTDLIETF